MRFFTASLIALSTLAAAVLAQENPITYPSAGDKVEAGSTVEIRWTPTSDDKEVTLVLRVGDSKALGTVGTIVENTENDGSYTWTAPDDLVAGQDYAIQIVYSTGSNYSPQFEIDSSVTAPTTTATTATATETETSTATEESSTETSATETETSTTEATTSTTEITTTATTDLISTITPSPNTTVTTLTTKTTTTKPRTTSTNVSTGAPDPGNAAGLGKTVSGGLVVLVAAAWALML